MCSQAYIDAAFSVKPRSAELMYAHVDVDEVTFNRGYYTVDVTYFYKIKGEAFPGGHEVTGLAVFDKRVILFGSEGGVKTFSSDGNPNLHGGSEPIGVVEAVDPITLGMKLVDVNFCTSGADIVPDIPATILESLGEEVVLSGASHLWYVTLGQFSIIRLERSSQLVIPVYDYCFPEKECAGITDDDPCTLFSRINFPLDEFFPPDSTGSIENNHSLT
jgi:hypothetical protein